LLSRYPCAPKICAPNDHLNTVSFYDAFGDQISSTDNGVTTQYLIDPMDVDSVKGTFTQGGDVIDHYVYGNGLFRLRK
jgi:hypothetical protein